MRLKLTVTHLILFLVSLVLFGCSDQQDSQNDKLAPLPVQIGMTGSIFSFPLAIADEQYFFEAEGLDAKVTVYGSGKKALQGLLGGEVEYSTTADAPIAATALQRQDFEVLATFIRSYRHGKILARKDRGINSISDLVGKTIGLSKSTTGDYFLHRVMHENNIGPDQVNIKDIPIKQLQAAVISGEVDAISSWEPYISYAEQELGDNSFVISNNNLLRNTFNLITMKETSAGDKTEKSLRVLKAINRAIEFARQEPAQAQEIIARRTKMDPQILAKIWPEYEIGLLLDHALLLTIEAQARWSLQQSGKTVDIPNYLEVINPAPLRMLQPKLVDPSY